jgi:hypothetical protein
MLRSASGNKYGPEAGSPSLYQLNPLRLAIKIPRIAKPRSTSINISLSLAFTGAKACINSGWFGVSIKLPGKGAEVLF